MVKTIEEGNVEIDLSKTRLEGKKKQELWELFNSFKGLFSDKPGLTHVLYHEIDTEDKPPVVSRSYRYDREGIKTDETKVRAIVERKLPRNSKEVSKFLGMSQWYAKFIKNYVDLYESLYNIKRKLKTFCWSIEAQKAFDVVKAAITKVSFLKLSDFKKPFQLFTDANSLGVGAVLNQEQKPVVYASRTLSSAEKNYTVTERMCLAVVSALNKFRTYLGSLLIKIITDHAALTCLTHGKNLSSRMIRWLLK
ncbi:retrovirus-related Pol polyprotein from transposon 297 [Trichonephila clavipes]|nr:retrovirus-related Pol polyprotein from transposon 297 [Trichonephila clavipes]